MSLTSFVRCLPLQKTNSSHPNQSIPLEHYRGKRSKLVRTPQVRWRLLFSLLALTSGVVVNTASTKSVQDNNFNINRAEIALTGLLAFKNWTPLQQQVNVLVTGRAIDEQMRPVSDAIVTLYSPPCRSCLDHVFPVGSSRSDGTFFIEFSGNRSDKLTLFIESPQPRNSWAPLRYPPFQELARLKQVRGYDIRPPREGQVDLGNVPVSIHYATLNIDVSSVFGGSYKPGDTGPDQIGITIRDSRKNLIFEGPVPPKAFDQSFTFLNLALTKGKWTIELFLRDNENNSRKKLSVKFDRPVCKSIALVNGKEIQQPCK